MEFILGMAGVCSAGALFGWSERVMVLIALVLLWGLIFLNFGLIGA